MAFGILNDKSSKHYLYKCLSTDTKPTTFEGKTIPGGSQCYETDTTTLYEFDGEAWVLGTEYTAGGGVGLESNIAGEDHAAYVLRTESQFNKTYITLAAPTTTDVKATAGFLHSIVINTPAATGTITVYDDTTGGTTTPIAVITSIGTDQARTIYFDCVMDNGIQIVTATAAQDITVTYR